MGFGFNIFVFPALLLISFGFIVVYIFARKKILLRLLLGVWALVFLFILIISVKDFYQRPMHLTKQEIIGEYRIDTTFYPGRNARWQYERYRFFITDQNMILFKILNKTGSTDKEYSYKIKYFDWSPDLWSIESTDTTFHIIKHRPELHRTHSRFYYVFHSHRFGNMFFRKVGK